MIRLKLRSVLFLLMTLSIIISFILLLRYIRVPSHSYSPLEENVENSEHVVIVVVVCGQRSHQALIMMKSALIFQLQSQLTFIVVAEFNTHTELRFGLQRLQSEATNVFSYELWDLSFPTDREKEWRSLFKPCATQRLFLPTVLTNHTKILYVDTDVIFLNDLADIWQHFRRMNASQIAALVLENDDPNVGWYSRFARHPYYGKLGVNSAVMLMNLRKMREFKWTDLMNPILTKYKQNLTWGDQDIINIIFHYYSEKLYIYPCRYNYRGDQCMYNSLCSDADLNGVSVLHGSRNTFHNEKQPAFRAIYRAFEKYKLGTDIRENLIEPLRRGLQNTTNTNCGALMNIFIKNLIRVFAPNTTDSNVS